MGSNILIVDDEASMRRSLSRLLKADGHIVRVADSAYAALSEAHKKQPDLVLLDIYLPDISGFDVLRQLKEINTEIVVIAMTAYESVKDAVQAMKIGAYDYLAKPFNIEAMRLLIKKSLNGKDRHNAKPLPRIHHGSACDKLISESPAMKKVLDIIYRLPSNSASNVLTEGETGTGKDLVARAIHETSCRADEPFLAISCAAIPRDLLESELFGYESGAFTGALPGGKPGIFERAGGGTVFLDEIGELDGSMQVKLLRILESREFSRIGGLKTIAMNARIIAATNLVLKNEVKKGNFRADLYYRLNVVAITLPPLKEHKMDIMPLAESYMREFSARFNKLFSTISAPAKKLLTDYQWPGNVRELRNVIERIVLMEDGDEVLPIHLPVEIQDSISPSVQVEGGSDCSSEGRLGDVEKSCIAQALDRTDGNVARAARLLGLGRGALRYRMDKYGMN